MILHILIFQNVTIFNRKREPIFKVLNKFSVRVIMKVLPPSLNIQTRGQGYTGLSIIREARFLDYHCHSEILVDIRCVSYLPVRANE